ncbi:trypsin-like serine peptidase [Actinomadura kijaniata]|uniref:trypsin-like serine peptidase n=1 Tax=Actinomadura kijaniata TaxID=46161 RepID=UPI000830EC82|nr:hypothetical protein [Actinomadura kijaniata]
MDPRPFRTPAAPALAALAALTTAALSVAVPAGPASASDAGPAAVPAAVHRVAPDLDRRARAYWTPRRMRAAAPPEAERRDESAGAPWTRGGLVARSTGRVFATSAGREQVCSAAVVRAANRDLVVTAAHCVRPAGGGWADNWIFVPGYRDGAGPHGGFTARRMFVPAAWTRDGDGDHDVAFVALATAGGRHVADVAGAQRLAFGGPGGRLTHVFGYPAAGRFDGERLAYCSGRPVPHRRGLTAGRGLRCGLPRGVSGGPWLTGLDPGTGAGTVVSVSSFRFSDDPGTLYGPPFGKAVRDLYARASVS